jgi:hypothetical protein
MICSVMVPPDIVHRTACPFKKLSSCELLTIPASAAAGSYITKCTQNTNMTEITQGRLRPALHLLYALLIVQYVSS